MVTATSYLYSSQMMMVCVVCLTGGDTKRHRPLTAVESRALQWLAWARGCVGERTTGWEVEDFNQVAWQLAACKPYRVSCQDVELRCLHCTLPESEMAVAANASVVGLLNSQGLQPPALAAADNRSDAGAAAGSSGAAQQVSGPQPNYTSPASAAPSSSTFLRCHSESAASVAPSGAGGPPACLGLGLVRAVDVPKRLLYVLTPLDKAALQTVDILQVRGRLTSLLPCCKRHYERLASGHLYLCLVDNSALC